MYKPPQQQSKSRIPTTAPKKSSSQQAQGGFLLQPRGIETSGKQQDAPKYSQEAADHIMAKMLGATAQTLPQPNVEKLGLAQRVIQSPAVVDTLPIQAKLTVGAPGDRYEQEADRMASQVMSMSNTALQRQMAPEEQTEEKVQTKRLANTITPIVQRAPLPATDASLQAGGNIESRLNSSKSGGSLLADDVRGFMEPRFGTKFDNVRVHTGEEAIQMNRELGAQAFAHGSNIYFGAGKAPAKDELTAHELTHVVQQTGSSQISRKVNQPNNTYKTLPSITPQTSPHIVQRDIKGSGQVPFGDFKINMAKVENPAYDLGSRSGEVGTVEFKPNDKAADSKSISFKQIVKIIDISETPVKDLDWGGDEYARNLARTKASSETYKSEKGDTLKSISKSKCKSHITPDEIYQANKGTLTSSDPTAVIPEGTTLSIPKVRGGYVVDHRSADVGVRRPKDKEVQSDFRYYWPNKKDGSQDGSKQGTNIQKAVLWDFPKADIDVGFNFETVAYSKDLGINYGTVHWNFTIQSGKIIDESYHIEKGTSDTFQGTLLEFNKLYKNPHTVMKGETLLDIANKYYGKPDRWQDIYKANQDLIKDQNHLEPGLKLRIPDITA